MTLNAVTTKISDKLLEHLQWEADIREITLSELLREKLERGETRDLVERLDLLERQVLQLNTAIEKLVPADAGVPPTLAAIQTVSENLSRLLALLQEEKDFPFGMNLDFFHVALMASFTLARGTFSHNPEAWEPYKEEARRRAFSKERGATAMTSPGEMRKAPVSGGIGKGGGSWS